MEKLVCAFKNVEEMRAHEAKWGRFNDPLPNMKEVTENEFATCGFFTWVIEGVEFRQIDPKRFPEGSLRSPLKYYFGCKVFYSNGPQFAGYVMGVENGRIRYFTFTDCEHKYRELSQPECRTRKIDHFGNCYHVSECVHCGRIISVDSSG